MGRQKNASKMCGLKISILFLSCLVLSSSALLFQQEKKEKKGFWDKLSISLPGYFSGTQDLPMTEREAIRKGWKITDKKKCDEHQIFRGNRYRYKENYGNLLIFDSNGRIAGMQAAIPTSVPMVEKRKYMMPVENGRYHLTAYFVDPKTICSAPERGDRDIGDRLLIQTGKTWETTTEVPMDQDKAAQNLWVKGKCIPQFGTYHWYNVSRDMDCEMMYPVFALYSKGKLNAFGWSLKGYFNDEKFDHPSSDLAWMAFDSKTFPECIRKSKTQGSTQHVYFQSGF